MTGKLSDDVLRALWLEAEASTQPKVTKANLSRLIAACDSLIDGTAAAEMRVGGMTKRVPIEPTPTSIETYIKFRRQSDRRWTGPVRVTIQNNPMMRDYMRQRWAESAKAVFRREPQSQTDFQRDVEDILSSIRSVEDANFLRRQIVSGRAAREELNLFTALLKKRSLKLEDVLNGRVQMADDRLDQLALLHIRGLYLRLTDPDDLNLLNLEIYQNTVRQVGGLGVVLVYPDELEALRRLSEKGDAGDTKSADA